MCKQDKKIMILIIIFLVLVFGIRVLDRIYNPKDKVIKYFPADNKTFSQKIKYIKEKAALKGELKLDWIHINYNPQHDINSFNCSLYQRNTRFILNNVRIMGDKEYKTENKLLIDIFSDNRFKDVSKYIDAEKMGQIMDRVYKYKDKIFNDMKNNNIKQYELNCNGSTENIYNIPSKEKLYYLTSDNVLEPITESDLPILNCTELNFNIYDQNYNELDSLSVIVKIN